VRSTGDVLWEDRTGDDQDPVVDVIDELGGGRCDAAARLSDGADVVAREDVDDDEPADDSGFTVDELRVTDASYQQRLITRQRQRRRLGISRCKRQTHIQYKTIVDYTSPALCTPVIRIRVSVVV